MAEVFTPSWLCNRMLDDVDARLFGRNDVFNTKNNMDKEWHPVEAPVVRDGDKITWDAYVKKTVMEITCGEGPFIVSRYDTVSSPLRPQVLFCRVPGLLPWSNTLVAWDNPSMDQSMPNP